MNAIPRLTPELSAAQTAHDQMARNRASDTRPIARGEVYGPHQDGYLAPAAIDPMDRPAFLEAALVLAVTAAEQEHRAAQLAVALASKRDRPAMKAAVRNAGAAMNVAKRMLADHRRVTPHNRALERHHEVERPGSKSAAHRICTRLDTLLLGGTITKAQWQAGAQYRGDREQGEMGTRIGEGGPGQGGSGCPTQTRLDATKRLRQARAALSDPRFVVIADLLADDQSWQEIARRASCPRDQVMALARDALARLVLAYGLESRATRIRSVVVGREEAFQK